MTLATYKWTVENYHQAIDAGLFADESLELLRGNLVIMAPEREPHAYYTRSIGHYLQGLLGDRALVSEAHPIILPNNSEPEPDVAIVQPLGREYLQHHPYPENIFWLIEWGASHFCSYKEGVEKRMRSSPKCLQKKNKLYSIM